MAQAIYKERLPYALFGRPTIVAPKVTYIQKTNPGPQSEAATAPQAQSTASNAWASAIEVVDFQALSLALAKYEKQFGFSTIEMFQRYLEGKGNDDKAAEDWLDTYILYLGCAQVRNYSCP